MKSKGFIEKSPPREHMRCPVCGRITKMRENDDLPISFSADHVVEVRIQAFTGGGWNGPGSGFTWSARALLRNEARALLDIVDSIAARLRHMLED